MWTCFRAVMRYAVNLQNAKTETQGYPPKPLGVFARAGGRIGDREPLLSFFTFSALDIGQPSPKDTLKTSCQPRHSLLEYNCQHYQGGFANADDFTADRRVEK